MKKFLTICIAILYSLITSGFSVNVHYCMGELASVDLHDSHDEGCNKCGMEKKGECCKDEARFVKYDDSHQGAKAGVSLPEPSPVILTLLQPAWQPSLAAAPVFAEWAPINAPPPNGVPLYKQFCLFLI
ncbi:HYC_CC_PP family protein [Chitinophaga sp. NPDC101104]|uniref:HYC_CC_PP family protein n=1 Tax=Chitinophaga sp. NPDC101104 TaxID=3390561 RepID=UPI003D04FF72